MKRGFVLATALVLLVAPPVSAYQFEDGSVELSFKSRAIATSVTDSGNTRGPALAVMKDDTLLLGGGMTSCSIQADPIKSKSEAKKAKRASFM